MILFLLSPAASTQRGLLKTHRCGTLTHFLISTMQSPHHRLNTAFYTVDLPFPLLRAKKQTSSTFVLSVLSGGWWLCAPRRGITMNRDASAFVLPRGLTSPDDAGLWTVSLLIPLCVVSLCTLLKGLPDSHWQGDDRRRFAVGRRCIYSSD